MEEIPISVAFKGQKPPIKATWYTGVLRILHGERIGSARLIDRSSSIITRDLYISVTGYGMHHQIHEKDTYIAPD